MFRKYVHTLVLVCITAVNVWADVLSDAWAKYNNTTNPREQATALLQLGDIYIQLHDIQTADSLLDMAIDAAKLSANDTLLVDAYNSFLRNDYLDKDRRKVAEYSKHFLQVAGTSNNNTWQYLAYAATAKALIRKDGMKDEEVNDAMEKINKAYYYAGLSNNDSFKIDCFLIWGDCLKQTNKKLDAFRYYLNALYLAQKSKNTYFIYESYGALSEFYYLIDNNERARDYKLKQIALLDPKVQDSTTLMNLLSDLSICYYYNQERVNAEKITNRIIQYAKRHNDSSLFYTAIFNHRSYLSENGLFSELADFYTQQYPEQLQVMQREDAISYYRVMAYVCENKGQRDSAQYYFELAEKDILATRIGQPIYMSNFMKRYGQFLLRTGNEKLALAKMQASYQYAKDAEYLPYLVETSAYLDSLNYKVGNLNDAYLYAKLNKQYADEQQAVTKQDAILRMEIDNEVKERELLAKQEQEHTEHRHNVQYMGIVVAIISIFVILMMLGYFRVPKIIIKSLGFFSFIFFFEFIILLADHKIMEITHHEPWKMLAIKILIISMLLPFHHWVEHKVIHYLTERKLVGPSRFSFRKLFGKKPAVVVAEEVKKEH